MEDFRIINTRFKTILNLAIPIVVALLSSNIMMLVDLAMVSSLGNNAIAAIGISIFLSSTILSFVIGFSPVVQGMVARRRGENSTEAKCIPLNNGLFLVLLMGIPISTVCFIFSPFLLSIVSSDVDVLSDATPYIRSLFVVAICGGMNSVFGSFWNGIARAKIFMFVILVINCVNIFLNYVLIQGNLGAPALGTLGAGIASVISTALGTIIYFVITFRLYKQDGFLAIKPEKALLNRIFRYGLPGSIIGASLSLGYIVFYWMVGHVGTSELAATNIIIRIGLFAGIFPQALGIASTTLISNTLGKGDPAGASRWGWDTAKVAIIWHIIFVGLPLFVFAEEILSLFLTDSETLRIAIKPLQLFAISGTYATLVFIFANTLTSLGDGKRVLIVTFTTQWLIGLPIIWLIGPYLNYGILEIWYVRIAYGVIATALIVSFWNDGRWKEIKL